MGFTAPTIEDFKTYYVRDFTYGTTSSTVKDEDLNKALNRTVASFPISCFGTQSEYDIGFYLLMAHYLTLSMSASAQGLASKSGWLTQSHSVGSVSESFSIPESILANPYFMMISRTNYGQEYLQMLYPKLTGQVFTAVGGTTA